MITGPGPRLVAIPIPTGIGPFPGSDGVRLPTDFNISWVPAASVRTDVHPCAVRRQRLIKIGGGVDLDAGRDVNLGADGAWSGQGHGGASH